MALIVAIPENILILFGLLSASSFYFGAEFRRRPDDVVALTTGSLFVHVVDP